MNVPVLSQAALNAVTEDAIASGLRLLQGCRFAATDEAHVAVLLDVMAPCNGDTIADIGCGFGEVARLMREQRPDLDFVLVNQNVLQLSHAPAQFSRILADMHKLPLGSASVDGAMFCYSLCHSDFELALSEAARVTRRGGFLFVYDYDRLSGDNVLMEARLAARAIHFGQMVRLAGSVGWVPVAYEAPAGDDALFRATYADDAEYDAIFSDLVPAMWKMVRA